VAACFLPRPAVISKPWKFPKFWRCFEWIVARSNWVAVMLSLVTWLGVSTVAKAEMAADGISVSPLRLTRGASTKIASGAVIRGERSLYSIDARAGQRLTLSISAVENNAVFQIYVPGARPERRDYGVEIVGKALFGAAEGDDATRWTGILRQTGSYLVVIGPTRGNAAYRLSVTIR
jgi:hypothetical protein